MQLWWLLEENEQTLQEDPGGFGRVQQP